MNKRVMLWYLLSLLLFWAGAVCAANRFPGGYDWPFRTVSSLASQKHNPLGGVCFASTLSLSMLLLWPCVAALRRATRHATQLRTSMRALQVGVVATALVGVDRLVFHDMSARIAQSHELVAVIALFALYYAVFSLLQRMVFLHKRQLLTAVVASLTLLAIAGILLWLSDAHHGSGQEESAGALLLSPPFWQWLTVALLWLGFGLLLLFRSGAVSGHRAANRHSDLQG